MEDDIRTKALVDKLINFMSKWDFDFGLKYDRGKDGVLGFKSWEEFVKGQYKHVKSLSLSRIEFYELLAVEISSAYLYNKGDALINTDGFCFDSDGKLVVLGQNPMG